MLLSNGELTVFHFLKRDLFLQFVDLFKIKVFWERLLKNQNVCRFGFGFYAFVSCRCDFGVCNSSVSSDRVGFGLSRKQ